jgi:hypothetical protein
VAHKNSANRKALGAAPVAVLVLCLLAPLAAGPVGATRTATALTSTILDSTTVDKTSEAATFAVIGGILCMVSLRLRQRRD